MEVWLVLPDEDILFVGVTESPVPDKSPSVEPASAEPAADESPEFAFSGIGFVGT